MPIYEYQCTRCGDVFEAFQKINDEPLKRCRVCRGKVEKLISQTSFQLKGSGWYLTDYARKASSESGDSGTKPSDSGAGEKSPGEKKSTGEKKASKAKSET